MPDAYDFKKQFKDFYTPPQAPMLIDVPAMRFLTIEGSGDPNEQGGAYQTAVEVLYGLCYTVKMSKMGQSTPKGYFDYIVPPLEGLWWLNGDVFDLIRLRDKSQYQWVSMIRQPDFVDDAVLLWAKGELLKKKPLLDTGSVRLLSWTKGLCVQCMHIGPFDDEPETLAKIEAFTIESGYENAIGDDLADGTIRRHHEIYLGDPRKTASEKLKTVLRHPVKKRRA